MINHRLAALAKPLERRRVYLLALALARQLVAAVVEHYVPQARTLLEAVRLLLAATSG